MTDITCSVRIPGEQAYIIHDVKIIRWKEGKQFTLTTTSRAGKSQIQLDFSQAEGFKLVREIMDQLT